MSLAVTHGETHDSWEQRNRAALRLLYSSYLRDTVLGDPGFDVIMTEDYFMWTEVEFENPREATDANFNFWFPDFKEKIKDTN